MKKLLYTLIFTVSTFFANATIYTVSAGGTSFNPQAMQVSVGDTILFTWLNGAHTTTSVSVPVGAATWDAPLTGGNQTFQYVVTVAGNYGYVCTPHASMGMAGGFTATSTGINTVTAPDMNIRLNAEKQLTILVQLPKTVNLNFSVMDVLGRSIISESRNNVSAGYQEYKVDVAELNAGYYFVRLTAGDKVVTRRIYIN